MNAIKLYRLSNYLYRKNIPFFPLFIKLLTFLVFNSVVPYTAKIGKESKFAYGGIGVVIHSQSVIGKKVIIGQNVTIGRKLSPNGIPKIGNNVYISAGSRIIGDIEIGNNVIIGTNSVVTKDVPDNCIIAGAPAKVIREINEDIYTLLENIY